MLPVVVIVASSVTIGFMAGYGSAPRFRITVECKHVASA
jgi:hypothetical protein